MALPVCVATKAFLVALKGRHIACGNRLATKITLLTSSFLGAVNKIFNSRHSNRRSLGVRVHVACAVYCQRVR